MSLYFSHVAYERIEQQKQLQTADLLSNIAGSMGLFLGMSTVSAINFNKPTIEIFLGHPS